MKYRDAEGLMMKYFVLNPWKQNAYGAASRRAIETYCDQIEMENPQLAADLRQWLVDVVVMSSIGDDDDE